RCEEFSGRFLREAQALASLNHPNIVTIYDFGEVGGVCYFIMEFVEGCDLREMIASRSIKPYDAMNIAVAVSNALQYAHDRGVVHRDVKPANILVDKSGKVKIADFGLSKILNPAGIDFPLTMTNESMGTPYYMAPEQIDPSRSADSRVDIYALGIIMYEMLTGDVPLGHFGLPSAKCGTSLELDGIILKALDADPQRRYQQAADIRTDIERLVASGNLDACAASSPRFLGPAITGGVITAVIIGGLTLLAMLFRNDRMPDDVIQFGGKSYRVFHENVGWREAAARCRRMGGRLAIVQDKDQDEFLASISRSHVWLGATDEGQEGKWVWADGSSITYTNWDKGEPNNARDLSTGECENYLMLSKYGKWNDFSERCRIIDGFICEWESSVLPAKSRIVTPDLLHAALKKANPRYNGKGIFSGKDGEIMEVGLLDTGVTNLAPLKGLRLTSVNLNWTGVTDLSPLENMPLRSMELTRSQVADISPLAGMPLVSLRIDGTRVRDLSPVRGMLLTYLDVSHTKVSDLSPLAGMPLRELHMNCVKVKDISPLAGMPLRVIGMLDVPVQDLSPLGECRELESAVVPVNVKNLDVLKSLPRLKMLNNRTPAEFWLERESATNKTVAGEIKKQEPFLK
ncbi:protein containing Serine/threonine protein kinase // C-type lectin // C-type lectin, partial [sediment metagenome]